MFCLTAYRFKAAPIYAVVQRLNSSTSSRDLLQLNYADELCRYQLTGLANCYPAVIPQVDLAG